MKVKVICLGCVASLLISAGTVLASDNNIFKKNEENEKEKASSEVVETYNFEKKNSIVSDFESELPDLEESDELPDEEPVSAPDVPGKITEDDTLVDENWTDFY